MPATTWTAAHPGETSQPLDISRIEREFTPPLVTLRIEHLRNEAKAAVIIEDTVDNWQTARTIYILHATGQPGAQLTYTGRPTPTRATLDGARMRLRLLEITPGSIVTATLTVENTPVTPKAPAPSYRPLV